MDTITVRRAENLAAVLNSARAHGLGFPPVDKQRSSNGAGNMATNSSAPRRR